MFLSLLEYFPQEAGSMNSIFGGRLRRVIDASDTGETHDVEPAQAAKKSDKRAGFFANLNSAISIRYKLLFAIGVVAALTLVAAGSSIYSFSQIRNSFNELAHQGIAAIADASKLAVRSTQVATAAVDIS